MKKLILFLALATGFIQAHAQSFNSRSNTMSLDYSDAKKTYESTIPRITWQNPFNETVFLKDGSLSLELTVDSKTPLKGIQLTLKDKTADVVNATSSLPITEDSKLSSKITKKVHLPDGVNELEILVENRDGVKSSSRRMIHVGATALADAAKLGRKDYALIFSTDKYDNWRALVNPIYDSHTVADDLKKTYGFTTDIVENPTQSQVLDKLREYAEKKYGELD